MANSKSNSKQAPKFRFKKHTSIGHADAADDTDFLENCFVDTGELEQLIDTANPKFIILGRTGSGKTALLKKLSQTEETVVTIDPDGLALSYVSNSQELRFLADQGTRMDLFYTLLWKHVFAVELFRARYKIVNETHNRTILDQIRAKLAGRKIRPEVTDYLNKWGGSFWQTSDYRVKEVTKTLEEEVKKGVGGKLEATINTVGAGFQSSSDSSTRITQEEKAEVTRIQQTVVEREQIRSLSEVMQLLNDVIFDDRKRRYYITIDRLDEFMVDDILRYQLILALFQAARDFNQKIEMVKIIVAVREDLVDRVFRFVRVLSPGYQEEKYESSYLRLNWTREDLEKLLSSRVSHLIRRQYTQQTVNLRDILPPKIKMSSSTTSAVEYMLERTLQRPRDAISFLNECLREAEGKATISQSNIYAAEARYSEKRLRALADEWSADYPNLIQLCLMFKGLSQPLKRDNLRALGEQMLAFLTDTETNRQRDEIYERIEKVFNDNNTPALPVELIRVLYRVGFWGIRSQKSEQKRWSFQGDKMPEVMEESTFWIHPAFERVLQLKQ